MAEEFKEGIEEISPEEFHQGLRGVIIDEADDAKMALWVGFGSISIIGIVFLSWLFLFLTRTDEQILRENLASHQKVRQMLIETNHSISHPVTKREDVEQSVIGALNIYRTDLRVGSKKESPFIPEKRAALIAALEGLLRLDLASTSAAAAANDPFINENLDRLGRATLEYYDRGILKYEPLLQTAVFRKKIQNTRKKRNYNPEDLKALKTALEKAEKQESFSVVAPALTLGKWYRYHNDLDRAKRCFDIGRRYVEGMRLGGKEYHGRRPETLGPLWDEYVACMEGLMELAYAQGDFRLARSYLLRVFNTPSASSLLQEKPAFIPQHYTTQKLDDLEKDLAILQKANAFPLELDTFPHISRGYRYLHFEPLVQALKRAKAEPGREAVNLLWESLDDDIQKSCAATLQQDEVADSVKAALIKALNKLIDSSSFYKRVAFNEDKLSLRGRQLLAKESERPLSKEELTFLNRDILDASLSGIIDNPFVLSDGTRLHNALTSPQINQLLTLYKEELAGRGLSQQGAKALRARIEDLYQGREPASLQELYNQLQKKKEALIGRINTIDNASHQLHASLRELGSEIRSLEAQKSLDIDALLRLKREQESVESRQLQTQLERRRLSIEAQQLQENIADLSLDFKQKIADVESRIKLINEQGEKAEDGNNEQAVIQLAQIEKQLALHRQYLKLLEHLRDTRGSRELQSLHDERLRLDAAKETLMQKLSSSRGEERERFQDELNSIEDSLYRLVQRFNTLFDPLREVVNNIAAEEEEIWKSVTLLRETRDEILKIIGTDNYPGTLQEKTEKRSALLLIKPDDAQGTPLYESEIRRLTEQIAADHARLATLLQTERSAREALSIVYPHIVDTSFENDISALQTLKSQLNEQDGLIAEYNLLWQQNELEEDLRKQENIILTSFEAIATNLDASPELSQEQTENLTRYMQNILEARKKLTGIKRSLHALQTRCASLDGSIDAIGGRGYYLDSTEMFQMEHEMGLNLKHYRNTFEERCAIQQELATLIEEKEKLDNRKRVAVRQRSQAQIDYLLPSINEKEGAITRLVAHLLDINGRLKLLGDEYRRNYSRAQTYRKNIDNQVASLQSRINTVSQKISDGDETLTKLSNKIYGFTHTLCKTTTQISLQDLNDIDDMVAKQKEQVQRIDALYSLKKQEQYYQAKALWLLGKCFYEQSRLTTFAELVDSNQMSPEQLEDERRHGKKIVSEFDKEWAYSNDFLGDVGEKDGQRANFELWTDFLERSALSIFNNDLPKYAVHSEGRDSPLTPDQRQDNDVFIARSRFLSGQIYMKRALRYIRGSQLLPNQNKKATSELSSAGRSFSSFLEFSLPFYDTSRPGTKPLSEKALGSQEFPDRVRQPINLLDHSKIFQGIIAAMKGDHLQAISHYRDMLATLVLRDEHGPMGLDAMPKPVDPLLLRPYEYDPQLAPEYVGLLANHPLAHELLYRLGKSYQVLAEQSFEAAKEAQQKTLWPINHSVNEAKTHRATFEKYASLSVAYYSQLILTQSFSPYRRAAILKRALMRKQLGQLDEARLDLLRILGDPTNHGGSWDIAAITSKGDLPGELNPGYVYVAFELGKLQLETGDFAGAADTFLKASDGDAQNGHVLQSRIAYAQALKSSGNWLHAHYFLSELLREKASAAEEIQPLYHPDLILDLSEIQMRQGLLKPALETLCALLKEAPYQLVNGDHLDLSDKYGMARLRNDYRDIIRPLAERERLAAEIHLSLKNFDQAKQHFANAQTLFAFVPWREDRLLRDWSHEAYLSFTDSRVLEVKWGELKADVLALLNQEFFSFTRDIDKLAAAKVEDSTVLLESIDRALAQVDGVQDEVRSLIKSCAAFYDTQKTRMPEVIAQKEIEEKRRIDKQMGGQKALKYDALTHMRRAADTLTAHSPKDFLEILSERFSRDSVEYKLLDDFVMDFAKKIALDEEDRAAMRPGGSDIENLLAIPDANETLVGIEKALKSWLQNQMVATGLDEMFIPLSEQSAILEEVALYRACLLSHLTDYDSYYSLQQLVNPFIEAKESVPCRVHSADIVWQMVNRVATAAYGQKDWARMAKYCEYLLAEENAPLFIPLEERRYPLIETLYGEALVMLAKKGYEDLVFLFNEEEKIQVEELANRRMEKGCELLRHVLNNKKTSADHLTASIRSKQLLDEIGV